MRDVTENLATDPMRRVRAFPKSSDVYTPNIRLSSIHIEDDSMVGQVGQAGTRTSTESRRLPVVDPTKCTCAPGGVLPVSPRGLRALRGFNRSASGGLRPLHGLLCLCTAFGGQGRCSAAFGGRGCSTTKNTKSIVRPVRLRSGQALRPQPKSTRAETRRRREKPGRNIF